MKVHSIKFKLRVLFVAILGAILLCYSIYIYLSLYVTLFEDFDDELNIKAQEIAAFIYLFTEKNTEEMFDFISRVKEVISIEEFPDPDEMDNLQKQWLQIVKKLNLRENYIQFLNVKGESLLKSNNVKVPFITFNAEKIEDLKEGSSLYKNTRIQNMKMRVISYPYYYQNDELYIIQVGASLKPVMNILRNRLIHIFASIPVILIISALLSKIFSDKFLRPVFEITRTASKISNENLSARVDNAHIDEEIKYLVVAFNDMISRLEQSFKCISDFSSHVAHELKTPLTIIKGESDIALRRERETDEYKKTIQSILVESDRMRKIIEDLLLLTKLEFPQRAFTFERFNIIELIKEVYEHSKILAQKKAIAMSIHAEKSQIWTNGDRVHLRRMFLNLIDNSIKFTNKKGKIDIKATQLDKNAIISIADTGIGIAVEDQPKIFDRFYSVISTSNDIEHGTGLGLSIVKSIVDIHNGSISVKSELGKGSTFSIELPVN